MPRSAHLGTSATPAPAPASATTARKSSEECSSLGWKPHELAGQDHHVVARVAGILTDPRVLLQVRDRHLVLVGQPVAHRQYRVERLRVQRYPGQPPVVLVGRAPVFDGDRHIHLPVEHHRHARVALRVLDPDPDAGGGERQLGDRGGEHQADARGERGDRDRTGVPRAVRGELGLRPFQLGEDRVGMGQQDLMRRR